MNAPVRFFGTGILALVLALPFSAGAITVADLTAQATALLQQVQALQAQLGGTTSSTVATNSAGFCPGIGRSLKSGSSGDDVTRLQQFLALDPAIYPEAKTTGYFGSLTESAVKRWQVKFNIVSSGTPTTTGYGVVGPRTAAAIAIVCSGGSYNGVSGAAYTNATNPGGDVGGFIKVTPIQGAAPLGVSIEATINTTKSCAATVYVLDYGDQSTPQLLPLAANACAQQVSTLSHTYTSSGTFTVALSAEGHMTTASVQVTGAPAKIASVSISDNAFTPRILSVESGTKVTWTNAGTVAHTVTADNNSFTSGTLQPGTGYSQTFTLVGNYPYHCSIHGSGMSGTVVVTPNTPDTTSMNTAN